MMYVVCMYVCVHTHVWDKIGPFSRGSNRTVQVHLLPNYSYLFFFCFYFFFLLFVFGGGFPFHNSDIATPPFVPPVHANIKFLHCFPSPG